jgi:ribonuclease-3
MDQETIAQIEKSLDYHFENIDLLKESMTHSSLADDRLKSNERLEFFGDSILGQVICEELFTHFPNYQEGDLTKIKSMLVSRKTCAKVANKLKLSHFINVGKGMEKTRAMSGSIAAGTFEAVIAAIYLDGGYDAAQKFILDQFCEMIKLADAEQHQENFKSLLQQYVQQHLNNTPEYMLLDEKGPDHNKCFEVGVSVGNRHFPSAWGITKKDAEQKAALHALIEFGVLGPEEKENYHHESM